MRKSSSIAARRRRVRIVQFQAKIMFIVAMVKADKAEKDKQSEMTDGRPYDGLAKAHEEG